MVDLNAHEAGNGGKKPREAYRLPSLLYSERPLRLRMTRRTNHTESQSPLHKTRSAAKITNAPAGPPSLERSGIILSGCAS